MPKKPEYEIVQCPRCTKRFKFPAASSAENCPKCGELIERMIDDGDEEP